MPGGNLGRGSKKLPHSIQIFHINLKYTNAITQRCLSPLILKIGKLFHITIFSYMGSGGKSGPFRTVFNTIRPWVETCQHTRRHQNILKITIYRLDRRNRDARMDR